MVELKDIIALVMKAGKARGLARKFAHTSVMARRMNDLAEQYEAELLILYEMLAGHLPESRHQMQVEGLRSSVIIVHENKFPERLHGHAGEVAPPKLRCLQENTT